VGLRVTFGDRRRHLHRTRSQTSRFTVAPCSVPGRNGGDCVCVCVALHAGSLAALESARGLRDDALVILSERNWIGMGNPALSAARRGLQSVCVELHARSLAALESTRGLRDDALFILSERNWIEWAARLFSSLTVLWCGV